MLNLGLHTANLALTRSARTGPEPKCPDEDVVDEIGRSLGLEETETRNLKGGDRGPSLRC